MLQSPLLAKEITMIAPIIGTIITTVPTLVKVHHEHSGEWEFLGWNGLQEFLLWEKLGLKNPTEG